MNILPHRNSTPIIASPRSLIEGIFLGAILLMLVTAGLVHTGAVPHLTQPSLTKAIDSPSDPMVKPIIPNSRYQ